MRSIANISITGRPTKTHRNMQLKVCKENQKKRFPIQKKIKNCLSRITNISMRIRITISLSKTFNKKLERLELDWVPIGNIFKILFINRLFFQRNTFFRIFYTTLLALELNPKKKLKFTRMYLDSPLILYKIFFLLHFSTNFK